jgi:hypothetical protein
MRVVVAAAVLLVGCRVNDVDYTGKACPCPSGWTCDTATNTCARSPGGDDAAIDAPSGPMDSAMPAAFKYRRRITIKTTPMLPAGFTIRVPLDATLGQLVGQGKVLPNYSDLRVIGDGALDERDRIIDPPGGPAPVALSFSLAAPIAAGVTDTEYALYYGSATVGTAPENGTAVFAIYDDFTTGISNVWLKNDGPTTSNGQLILRANHSDALTTSAVADKLPIVSAVELVATVVDPTSDPTTHPDGTFYYWFGYQRAGDFTPVSDPWVLWIARGKNGIGAEQKSPVGCEAGCEPLPGTQDTAAHYYAIERDPTETRFREDGASVSSSGNTIHVTNSTDYSPMVRNFMATSDVLIDYIRARGRVSPDPAISVGPEEAL